MPVVVDQSAGTLIDAPASQTLKFGSFKLTLTGAGLPGGSYEYILEEISLEGPMRKIETTDENGVINKRAFVRQPRDGTMTLQIKAADSICPPNGAMGLIPEVGGVSAIAVMVTGQSQVYNQNDQTKIKVPVSEVLNGI